MTQRPDERRRVDDPRLVVVLPVYDEADSIGAVLGEVREAAERLALGGVSTVVVVVDDESPDGTGAVATAAAQQLGLEMVLVGGKKQGLGAAMLRGFDAALALSPQGIVTLDGDGQHNPAEIPTLYRAFVARHADVVVGSRWTRGGRAPGTSIGRSLGSRVSNWLFRVISGTRGVRDATTSFRVYSPRVVRFLLDTDSNRYSGYSFFSTTIGLAEAAGFFISEVPIEFRPRYGGQSKLNRREALRYFRSLSVLREERRRITGGPESPYQAKDEIALLAGASNWNRFVVEAALAGVDRTDFQRVIEVGAGLGGVTQVLLDRFPQAAITAIEPDRTTFSALAAEFTGHPRVTALEGTLDAHRAELAEAPADLVIYVSVLEHVEHDEAELVTAAATLRPGGVLSIFVPASPWLYGPIDAKSGHYRRYTLEELRSVVEAAGFTITTLRYVDRLGILPYWLNYRLLNKSGLSGVSAWTFDKVFVPAMAATDRVLGRVNTGRNAVCVAVRR